VRRRKREVQQPGSPLWMTTYADMVTNLLALFVLLYAFSVLDVERFQTILTSFQAYAGVLDSGQLVGEKQIDTPTPMLNPRQEDVAQQLGGFVEKQGLAGDVEVIPSHEGVVLRVNDEVMFASGQAELRPSAKQILTNLVALLEQYPYPLRIEGHTDSVPINNAQFPSNWELSVYRASRVVRFLEEISTIPSARLSAVGYGEHRPIAPNDTAKNRQRNRRVDIIVLLTEHNDDFQAGRTL
jgi:chemotaxis protein MotB